MYPIPTRKNMHFWWIKIKKSPKYKLYDNFKGLSKKPFDIKAIIPRGILELFCVHIPQLMTYPAVYTLPFTLQLCYKPLGISKRVTKSQKFIYQIMMYCKNLTSGLLDIGWRSSQSGGRENGNFLLPLLISLRTIKNRVPAIWESIHHIKWEIRRNLSFHNKTHGGYSSCKKNF